MRKLPLLVERTIHDSETARSQLALRFDHELQVESSANKRPVTCQRGCSHCCYHPVVVNVLEGISIFRALSKQGLWTQALKRKLEEHHQKTGGLDYAVWLLSMIPCPFLKDHECSIYAHRPFFCRTTYSVGDPHYCHPHRINDATGLVSKMDVAQKLESLEDPLFKRHRLRLGRLRIPLSAALLLGEKVSKGEIDLEEVEQHILQDWTQDG